MTAKGISNFGIRDNHSHGKVAELHPMSHAPEVPLTALGVQATIDSVVAMVGSLQSASKESLICRFVAT